MLQKSKIRFVRLSAFLLICAAAISLSSCSVWSWLWSREHGDVISPDDMIIGEGDMATETENMFEGAIEYTGEAHSGTDIFYAGKESSPHRSSIIVVDAGHQMKGSATPEPNGPNSEVMKSEVTWGAVGVATGQAEYDLNLRVALLLRDELIRRGYSVVMIRETNNVDISNMERAQIANKYQAVAYVRIHANSWTDESMHGAMTISQSAANPYPSCAAHYTQSSQLSRLILDEFCAQTGIDQCKMREMDDMTGTNWSLIPTTIVEMGFLSHPTDDRLMATDYFRQEAAIGIANGIDAYVAWLAEQTADTTETAPAGAEPSSESMPTETTTEE